MAGNIPKPNQREGKQILVVDDEPRMIGFIRMNLELRRTSCNVEAHSGLEALRCYPHQIT